MIAHFVTLNKTESFQEVHNSKAKRKKGNISLHVTLMRKAAFTFLSGIQKMQIN